MNEAGHDFGTEPVPLVMSPKSHTVLRASAVMFVVAVVTLVVDLGTKRFAHLHYAKTPHVVVKNLFQLVYTENPGASFSMLRDAPKLVRLPVLVGMTVVALIAILSFARRPADLPIASRLGLALLAGGALGNLIDRLRYGVVTDFLDVFIRVHGVPRHWPIFNVADIAICVGVGLLISMATPRGPIREPAGVL